MGFNMKKVNPKSTLLILTALSLGILPISHVLISSPLHAAESSGRAVEPTSFAFPPGTRQPGRRANNVAKVYADDVDALNDLVYQGKRLYLTDLIRKKTLQCIQYCRVAVNEAVQGRIMEAIRNSKKALHLAVDAKQEYLLAYSKRDLASAYNIAGKDDLALRLADEALEHQSHVGMDAEALLPPLFQIRGDILLRRGDANAALEEYSRAIGYLYLKQRPFVSSSMMRAHIAAGNMVKASGIAGDLLAESAPSFRQVGLIGMGKIALRQGRPSDAIGYFNDTLKVGAGIPYLNIEAFEGLGQSNVALGDQQGAIAAYLRAARAAESLRLRFNGQEFRAGVFGQMQRIFNETVRLLMESSQTGAAWEVSERGRSRALLDMVRGGVTRSESGAVVSAASNGATTLVDLQQNLPANSVVVQYHVLGDRTYVWAITKERVSSHLISASRDVLSAKISEFRNAIVDRSAQVDILARGLYELLLKPLNLPHVT